MAKPLDNPIKELRTELYRDDGTDNDGVPRWYRLFIINYEDGSGETFKFLLEDTKWKTS